MTVVLENQSIPDVGPLEINIKISTNIGVSAREAQRKVSMLLFHNVSYLMHGEAPQLVIGDHVAWRVPAYLTLPQLGRFGPLATLDVDANTGAVQPLTSSLRRTFVARPVVRSGSGRAGCSRPAGRAPPSLARR